jgi:hypothetical protein
MLKKAKNKEKPKVEKTKNAEDKLLAERIAEANRLMNLI